MDSEDLKVQGISNIADLLNQSPVFRDSDTAASRTTGLGGNPVGNYVNLRGLGANRTLVLLNGNRIVPTTNVGTTDLNLIPTVALDRTEIVTGGASAAWGSDAVAGVVNMITKKNYVGTELEVKAGQSSKGDSDTHSFSVITGHALNETNHLMFAAEYENSDGGGNVQSRDWSDQMIGYLGDNDGGFVIARDLQFGGTFDTAGHILGAPPLGGQNFTADGTSFNPSTSPGINYGAGGAPRSGGDNHTGHPVGGVQLTTPIKRYSAILTLDSEISEKISSKVEINYGRAETSFNSVPFIGVQVLHNDNPYLPQEFVDAMSRPVAPVGKIGNVGMPLYRFDRENETLRASFALEGEINNDWSWDAHYSYGQNKNYSGLANNILSYVNADQTLYPHAQSPLDLAVDAVLEDGNIVCRSGAPGCVPFNFIGEGTYSQEAYDYISGTSYQNVKTKQHNFSANVNGEIGELPAGPVYIAAGYEYKVDKISGQSDEKSQNNLWDVYNPQPFKGSLDVHEVYTEVLAPISEDIDLNAAIRHAEYELAGGATTWKFGATYQINDELRLRASKSLDIRAPNLREVFLAGQTGQVGTLTGYTGPNDAALILRKISGNSDLIPEESETLSFGFSYRPEQVDGLYLGADYYDISIDDAIASLGATDLVSGCQDGSGNLDYCSQIDFVGDPSDRVISEIREQPLNIDTIVIRGLDIELGYKFEALDGEFNLRTLGGYTIEITDSGSGNYDRAGQIGPGVASRSDYSAPEWIWDANVNYKRDAFSINLHARYIDSGVIDVTAKAGGLNEGKIMSALHGDTLVEDNNVASKVYVDLSMDYEFTIDGQVVKVFGGIKNLFDTTPPEEFGMPLIGGSRLGGLYDTLGTTYQLGLRTKF